MARSPVLVGLALLCCHAPSALALRTPAAPSTRAGAGAGAAGRRKLLAGAAAAAAAALLEPVDRAHASYALYQASQDSYIERKQTGFVPVATNDRATLKAIQGDIATKRPQYAKMKANKKQQYCAGQTASVTPLLENACEVIGISKADQSNTMVDDFGNMNIGVYNSKQR